MSNFLQNTNQAARAVRSRVIAISVSLLCICGPALTASAQSTATNVVSGFIGYQGQQDAFFFNLPADSRYYFDALSNASPLEWSLSGPEGAVVTDRSFSGSDGQNISDPTVWLTAGNYALTVKSAGGTTNGYGFRFVNLADATLLTPGTVVSNGFAPANRTDLYQFTAAAGDRFYFHQITRTGLPSAWWRLMDPYGNQIFSQGFTDAGTALAPVSLPASGTYYLMVEGYIYDTGIGSYSFSVINEGNVPPASFTGTPMNLGDLIIGNLVANTTNSYTFNLATPARVVFDPQTNSLNVTWTLRGPSGAVVNTRGMTSSGGIYNFGPLTLPAGAYQLNVQGSTAGPYRFRLLDLAAALPLALGTTVTNVLNPASAAVLYQFSIASPGKYFFDSLAVNNLPDAYWRLVDTNNNVLFMQSAGGSPGAVTLNNPGLYTLLIEGYFGDPGAGTNVFKVTPITDGLQALNVGSLVTGAIATPGQRQQYTFSLSAAARLYFDSLTNGPNLRWSLDGPTGNLVNLRGFGSSDGLNIGNPLIVAAPGNYTLTITASTDNLGAYQFRLFDIASAAPLVPGAQINGTLNPANSTVAYQFSLSSPAKMIYDPVSSSGLPNTYVRLLDANGNVPITTSLSSVVGPLVLPAGNYTLLVEGYINDPGNGSYTFSLLPVNDGLQVMTVGSTVNGVIASPGQHQQYSFTLGSPSQLYFDSLTNNSNLRWSLDGPTGNLVNSRSFTSSDAQTISNPFIAAPAGNYVLTVTAISDNVGGYQFRLFDLASAPPLTPGNAVSAALSPANSSAAYQFTLSSPGKFIYDPIAVSGLPNAYVRLVDGYGNILIVNSFPSVMGPLTLPAGHYAMLVEGYINDPGTGTYSFNLEPVIDGQQTAATGSTVTGAIGSPGQQQQYTFTLTSAATLYFDSLTNNSNIRWSLDGPIGNVVNSRSFSSSDAQSIGNPLLSLVPGDYVLSVFASSDNVGGYQFRLLDLAAATPLTPGTPVNVSGFSGNRTAMYRFTAAAGDLFTFDSLSSTGMPNAYWRLVDPYNSILFSQSFSTSVGTNTLRAAGTYTLLIEGYIQDNATASYSFNVQPHGNVPPIPFTGTPLTIGTPVSAALVSNSATAAFVFTLPAPARLFFDALTNVSLTWSLFGPSGTLVNNRGFQSSDSADISDSSLSLPAGNYQLMFTGPAGPFAFNLLNASSASPMTLGTTVSNTLSPANSTVLYQFTGTAGQQLYFNGLGSSGFTYTPYCRLYGPLGNVLTTQPVNASLDTFTLAQSGTYTLSVEGRVYDTHASGNYAFNLLPVFYQTNSLTLGNLISSTIATPGQRQFFTFNLPSPARLYFDSLTNSGMDWRLDAPWGQIVNWRSFSGSDATAVGDPSLPLPAGSYTLAIAGDNFSVTGPYQFRLLNFANATPFTPGTTVNSALTPANSTTLYQFTGVAGQLLYFDGQTGTGFTYQPYCRLYGPVGNILFSQSINGNVDTFTLPQSGTYTLTVEGIVYDTHTSGNYGFNLLPVTYGTNGLGLGTTVNGAITTPGQRQFYLLSLSNPATLYFDALTNADFNWRLDATWGPVVAWRAFSGSDGNSIGDPSLPLPAGSYTLTVAGGSGFVTTGNYQFRLLNFANATPFTPGVLVSNSLSPANSSVLYQFNGTAGDRYYFDGQPASGFTYIPISRLYTPSGNILMSHNINADADTFALPVSGTYVVTVEGYVYDNNPSGTFAFNLVPNPLNPAEPLFPTTLLPDLVVLTPTVNPSSGLQSGGSATVQWIDKNTGSGATSGSFTDRVVIRNVATGSVLVDTFVPYNESDPGNGPLAPSATRNRQVQIRLPDGTNSVGTLQVTVTVDAQNALAESSEVNNSTSVNVTSTLAPYPDLLVSKISVVPPTGWLPGSTVTINWQLTNSGSASAATNWTDTVVIRNTNTSVVILNSTTNYNLADPGNGVIAPGDFRNRSISFVMPGGANAYGVFGITVSADSANQVFEYNPAGTAELNNSTTINILSAPDLVPTALAVTANGSIQSGSTINVGWNDMNAGTVDTGGAFFDRVTIANLNTAEVLFNSTLYYDPAATGNGPITPGSSRARAVSFQLPDGTRGVGTLQVSVALDTFAQVPEFNATGTGEANNSATANVLSTIANYPDLQVSGINIQPPVLNSGTNMTISWQDTNSGNGVVAASWYDRVTIVNTNLGITLLDTAVYYDITALGPLTNGTAKTRSVNFTLPNGANGAGTLTVTVAADTFNNIFEYNSGGTGEVNNTNFTLAVSGVAPYPDLQVSSLAVQPALLGSGTNLTVSWMDTNSGTAIAPGNWYDHLTISNSTLGVTLLDTTLFYDASALGLLTNGTAAPRSYNFTLPSSSNGAGGLVFTVTVDSFNNIFEFNTSGTGENNNTATLSRSSTLTPLPDLIVTSLTSTNTAFTSQIIGAQLSIANQGLLAANADMVQRVFLSSSPVAGSGTLVAQADYNGPLAAGDSLDESVTLLAPATPGTYWLIAQVDANNNVTELSEDNNYYVSPTPINVQAAYTASIVADIHAALANTPIPMHGLARMGGSGAPAPFVPLTIHIQVRGTDRTYLVLTAANGTFTNVFNPLPNEAGVYQLGVALPGVTTPPSQDTFTLIGMSVDQQSLIDLSAGASSTNTLNVRNLSDVPLTGVTVAVVTNQPNVTVAVTLGTNTLGAFANTSLTLTIHALDASIFQSPIILNVSSAEGATATEAFLMRVEALTPKLATTPHSLLQSMARGAQTPVSFTLNNQGGVATGPLQVILPNLPWLSLASASQMPPLSPGTNTVVTLLLTPASDLPLGDYNGNLVIQSTNAALSVPFSFRAISTSTGNMLVSAEDEYTFFASGSPPVTNAQIILTDALSGTAVVTNFTGLDGTASFSNLTEAFYTVDVTAPGHDSFRQSALVSAGLTTNVVAFLTRQTVTFDFTVVPTTVVDSYIFQINSTFETQVPVPVVTIDPASLDLSQYPGSEFQVLYTVANHGLIDAESTVLNFPNTPNLQFTALVTNLGKLPANSSFTIPVLVKRISPAVAKVRPMDYLTGQCSVTAQMLWNYLCGPNVVNKNTSFYLFDSTGCNLPELYSQIYDLVPGDSTFSSSLDFGASPDDQQQQSDDGDQLQTSSSFGPPPGFHFQCKTAPPAVTSLVGYRRESSGSTSVCAQVKIQLDQKGVITRDAFRATLELSNDLTNSLQNIQATVQITDSNGNLVGTNFALSDPTLSGLTAIDGTGVLPGATIGTATWTLIPTLDAAPTNGVNLYLVGGTLSYLQDGQSVTVPLAPAPIQVFPEPQLLVRYFHDRDVFADDPFTPQIEPSIPYSLAVQVNNIGFGPAQSLSISSGKPQIVDNVKGLLINFNILGTEVENQPVTPALNVNFGSIAPGTNAIARWLFTSTLQGSFTNFSASFSQVDAFGKPRLSLIQSVEIHQLSHIVDAGGTFEDSRPDFLVNDILDPDFLPDTLYLSSGQIVPVSAVTDAIVNGALSSSNLTVTVGATVPAGWSYLRFGDPGAGQFLLSHVYRGDGTEIPFGTNAWTTDRIFHGGDVVPTYTNQVHLLDYNSSGNYTLVYTPAVINSADTIPPVSSVSALPAASKPSFTVQWSGTDNSGGSGVAFFSIYSSTNGGPFGIWISNTPLQAAVFTGVPNATYSFSSRATDLAGNQEAAHAGADTQTATTAPANSPPVIAAIAPQTVAEGAIFSLTPSASDPDVPAQVLSWSLLPGSPAGALISQSSGLITWRTSPGDGGTTNMFAVVVTDNGSPSLSATQSFSLVVTRQNHAPSIVSPPLQVSVDQQATLSLPLSATDPDIPQQTLTWQLGPGAPLGLSLDSASGILTWTPTIAQGPSTNLITLTVRDNGVPPLSDTKQISIIVNAVNHAPVLPPINNQVAYALLPLTLSATATDPDVPAQVLTYSLDPGAPASAHIGSTNGLFTWTPTRAQSPSTNPITVRVTDNGLPALSSTRTFVVTVLGYVEAALGSTTIQSGQTGAVALTVNITAAITNVNFTLNAGSFGLTNFLFTQPAPVLQSATLQSLGSGQYLAQLNASGGQWLQGSQTLATLTFSSSVVAPSEFVPLRILGLTASQTNGVAISRVLEDDGRVVVLNSRPLLESLGTGSQFELRLFGPPAPSYTIQSTPSLIPPAVWSPVWTGTVDATFSQLIPFPLTNNHNYFRAKSP